VSAQFCIHGHFYQPHRAHPWLEVVEVDDTAAPAHDWNARIAAECYAPNAATRILDVSGRIAHIVNNYASISFNIGPTLAAWLEAHVPAVWAQIQRADRESLAARGYGNALAQPYNHVIMPLAGRRDKMTQVRWGIADFTYRFGRRPQGMWLPETAVDRETLGVLAECGVEFTILSPHQAARVRAMPSGEWVDVTPEVLDITRAYYCHPAPGLRIAIFFYERTLARDLAFGTVLRSGDDLANRLRSVQADGDWADDRLVHIANDGETYGHHHRFGEMALAYAIRLLEQRDDAEFTNYAAFLADHPPTHEVEIWDRTSWSCPHGVERWRSDCGCRTRPDWHQRWRAPLREGLDWLKQEIDGLFEDAGEQVFHDPWAARDAYVGVVLDRRADSVRRFLNAQALRPADPHDRVTALRLLEMQRHAMLMFTSDGWFFDELSRVEPVQILRHAARVLQLAAGFGRPLEAGILERLRRAESNLPEYRDGVAVYDRLVRPAVVDARRVAAHYAITSLFRDYPEDAGLYTYRVRRQRSRRQSRGAHLLQTGRLEIDAEMTGESAVIWYAALHVGGTEVQCSVGAINDDTYAPAVEALQATFEEGTVTETIRAMDEVFGRAFYTLRDLFTDERREVLAELSAETLEHLEATYRRLYTDSRGLMQAVRDAEVPVPREFILAAEFVLMTDLRRALSAPGALSAGAWDLVAEARAWGLRLPAESIEALVRARLESRLRNADGPVTLENLTEAQRALDFARDAGITLNLWEAQNLFQVRHAARLAQAPAEERAALVALAEGLHFNIETLEGAVRERIY
jgi:alpha-amylase/alpha-mannosidase (GH57 family)